MAKASHYILPGAGRQAEALERYQTLRRHLAEEPGTHPAAELQARTTTCCSARRWGYAAAPGSRPHPVPRRAAELTRVDRLLARSRLVTIASPARRRQDDDAPVSTPSVSRHRSSSSNSQRRTRWRPQSRTRSDSGPASHSTPASTSPRILDNCATSATEVAQYATQILATCPAVRILATSRTPLGTAGEHVFRLPPLAHRTAVELFTDRARLVNVTSLLPIRSDTIRQICRQLDGLPLAIELAAAWIRVLSERQVLDRLTPLHQRSTAATDHVRRPGFQLPPFRNDRSNGCSVAWRSSPCLSDPHALEAVADLDDDLLTALTALVDHSLVLTQSQPDGRRRFRLLEPVRQYAVTVFVTDDSEDSVRDRHAHHYLAVALHDDARLRGPDRAAALVDLRREEANLLAALAWARSRPTDLALRLSTVLGHHSEHIAARSTRPGPGSKSSWTTRFSSRRSALPLWLGWDDSPAATRSTNLLRSTCPPAEPRPPPGDPAIRTVRRAVCGTSRSRRRPAATPVSPRNSVSRASRCSGVRATNAVAAGLSRCSA